MDAQRALLDELMGAARNLTEEEKKDFREVRWDDREVCGSYMVRFCPHDLFFNTKSDLGPCPKIHDQKLKESFEKSPRHDMYVARFEAGLAQFCEKLVLDLDRKVRRGHERLAQDLEAPPPPPPPVPTEKSAHLSMLEDKIKTLLEQVESLGEAGEVDEAEALMRKVDMLNAEKTLLMQSSNDKSGLVQEKKMSLCEICGSFLVANDVAERVQSHITGKQHVGYGTIRDFINEYKTTKEKARVEKLAMEHETEDKRKREKENGNRKRDDDVRVGDRYKDYERERSRERSSRGSRDHERDSDGRRNHYRGGRDRGRDTVDEHNRRLQYSRDRSRIVRSRSPSRQNHRSSRSPGRPYY